MSRIHIGFVRRPARLGIVFMRTIVYGCPGYYKIVGNRHEFAPNREIGLADKARNIHRSLVYAASIFMGIQMLRCGYPGQSFGIALHRDAPVDMVSTKQPISFGLAG